MALPPILYKYVTASTARAILAAGRLRWSSPLLFNDVAEFQRMPRFDPPLTDGIRIATDNLIDAAFDAFTLEEERLTPSSMLLLWLFRALRAKGKTREAIKSEAVGAEPNVDAMFTDRVRAVFERFDLTAARVLCLTANSLNEVMWAHYADSHRGCVLGFTHLVELDAPLLEAQPVTYADVVPSVGSAVEYMLYDEIDGMRRRTLDAVCFTKKSLWSYEQEWRALTWRSFEAPAQFGDYRFYPTELVCGFRPKVITHFGPS